jgi:hypothetical protein
LLKSVGLAIASNENLEATRSALLEPEEDYMTVDTMNRSISYSGLLLTSVAGALVLAPLPRADALDSSRLNSQPKQTDSQVLLERQGTLEEGDSVLASDGSLYDEYTFEGEAGQRVTISLSSTDFDTYLALLGPDGEVIAQNDDIVPGNLNSELTVTLPTTGTYIVIANSFDNTGRGRYTVVVTTGQVATTPPDSPQTCPEFNFQGFYARVTTQGDDLRVRATPNGDVIGSIPNGWEVIVQERDTTGNWARVTSHYGERFGNDGPAFGSAPNFRNGWVSTDFLTDLGFSCDKPFNLRSLLQPALFGQRQVVVGEDWLSRGDRLARFVPQQPSERQ